LRRTRGDTYSWTNLQSDIAGVATHVDPNLVNPWGMAASSGGTIWVSDSGTGVSTLYHQDGTAVSLVVTIPPAARNKEGGSPTGVVFNRMQFFKVTLNGTWRAPSSFRIRQHRRRRRALNIKVLTGCRQWFGWRNGD